MLRFHQNFIVIYESEKFCCYPHGYTKNILPRCSVIGAEVSFFCDLRRDRPDLRGQPGLVVTGARGS